MPERRLKTDDGRCLIGALVGSFRILRKLGEGGMGVVYEAEHQQIARPAAVKLLHPRFARDVEYAQRFLNEARAVNVIRHRGLVEIFDFGMLPDGTLYYVMEFIEGGSLAAQIAEQAGPGKEAETVELGAQVARALAAAHQAGIVHRDLKPDNIMLAADPVNPDQVWVKILDFGIAKFRSHRAASAAPDAIAEMDKTYVSTRFGAFFGTQFYMAPEQHGQAEDADGRADVFSLGVVLYELLTGQRPFSQNALRLLVDTPPSARRLNRAVSRRLSRLVDHMLSPLRSDRPSMDEVAQQLAAMRPNQPRRWACLAATGGAGLLVGALTIMLLHAERSPSPAELHNRSRAIRAAYLQAPDAGLATRERGVFKLADELAALQLAHGDAGRSKDLGVPSDRLQPRPHAAAMDEIPVNREDLADQLLHEAKEGLSRKDYRYAQEVLDRVRRLVQRGKASLDDQAALAYQQGRLFEALHQLDAALTEYNKALNLPQGRRRPELEAGLQGTVARLASKVGRIQIFTLVDGKCQVSRELLFPPGEQVINVGIGQTRTVYARSGSITKVKACI